jgi:hypothetical protein
MQMTKKHLVVMYFRLRFSTTRHSLSGYSRKSILGITPCGTLLVLCSIAFEPFLSPCDPVLVTTTLFWCALVLQLATALLAYRKRLMFAKKIYPDPQVRITTEFRPKISY